MAGKHWTVALVLAGLIGWTADRASAQAGPPKPKPHPATAVRSVPAKAMPKQKKKKFELPHVRLSERDRQKIQRVKEQTLDAMYWALVTYMDATDTPGPVSSGSHHSSHESTHEPHTESKEKSR